MRSPLFGDWKEYNRIQTFIAREKGTKIRAKCVTACVFLWHADRIESADNPGLLRVKTFDFHSSLTSFHSRKNCLILVRVVTVPVHHRLKPNQC